MSSLELCKGGPGKEPGVVVGWGEGGGRRCVAGEGGGGGDSALCVLCACFHSMIQCIVRTPPITDLRS